MASDLINLMCKQRFFLFDVLTFKGGFNYVTY